MCMHIGAGGLGKEVNTSKPKDQLKAAGVLEA